MQALKPGLDLPQVLRTVDQAENRLLLLDFDGTLSPLHPDRHAARPYAGVPQMLDRIAHTANTRLVVISGRPCREVAHLLETRRQPEIWGSHGAECLLPNGVHTYVAMDEYGLRKLADADALMHARGMRDRMEQKAGSTAIHWRGLGRDEQDRLRDLAESIYRELGRPEVLKLRPFDGGIEFRVRGPHKGRAVTEILKNTPKDSCVAYLGDDQTDEDAFLALAGRGYRILVRTEPRATEADLWLRPPEELIEFLEHWTTRAKGDHHDTTAKKRTYRSF